MAVSKSTRRRPLSTRQPVLELFRKGNMPEERSREWLDATAHLEEDTSSTLRFPIYGPLHALNLHAQSTVDTLRQIGNCMRREGDLAYYVTLVQFTRSMVTADVLDHMSGIENTGEWIFDTLRREEERKLRDPEDVYIYVRRREAERIVLGMPPRIRFLDDESPNSQHTT